MKPRRVLSGVASKPFPSASATFITAIFVLLVGLCSLGARAQGTIIFTNFMFSLQFHGGGTNIVTKHYTQTGPVFGERLYEGLRLVRAGSTAKYFATERQDVFELDAARGTFTTVPAERIGPNFVAQG